MGTIKQRLNYFEYLVSLVPFLGRNYNILLRVAHTVSFYELVPNDTNRAVDGLELRDRYHSAFGTWPDVPDYCTFLEMLIGLSIRMNDQTYAVNHADMSSYWFWKLMENLGVTDYHDESWETPGAIESLVIRFGTVVERRYEPNGNGGLFPLRNPNKNQRTIELWYQMMSWLEENFDEW